MKLDGDGFTYGLSPVHIRLVAKVLAAFKSSVSSVFPPSNLHSLPSITISQTRPSFMAVTQISTSIRSAFLMSAPKKRHRDNEYAESRKKPRVDHQEPENDVCESCLRTWRQFADDGRYSRRWFGHIDKTKTELACSGCRICILYADILSTYRITGSPIRLRWDPAMNRHGPYGEIRLLGPDRSYQDTPPALLVSGSTIDGIKSTVEEFHADELRYDDIKSWVFTCQHTHGHSCKPIPSDDLHGLRVIDCWEREIVQAPPNCKFVALSYIWGAGQHVPKVSLEAAVATIAGSIDATLALGFRYIWVDQYVCVPNPVSSRSLS
jgi:hypothetical protein